MSKDSILKEVKEIIIKNIGFEPNDLGTLMKCLEHDLKDCENIKEYLPIYLINNNIYRFYSNYTDIDLCLDIIKENI